MGYVDELRNKAAQLTGRHRRAYLSVDCFFVLSGFVLAGSYGEKVASRSGYGAFIGRRFLRLFPVHFVALSLAAILGPSLLPLRVIAEAALVNRWWPWSGPVGDWLKTSAINPPDWSISTEWAASLLFPVFVIAILRGGRGRLVAAVSFLAFVLGYVVYANGGAINASANGTMLPMPRCLGEFGLGVALFRQFGTAALNLNRLPGPPKITYWLGEISYPIYLLHWPIAWALRGEMPPGIFTATAVILTLSESFAMHHLIEIPARELVKRRQLRSRQHIAT
jgi:peptidoglycan/LPS O-acetylase OafA/YrhL